MTNDGDDCNYSSEMRMCQATYEKIHHAEITLDRTIGFINNSDEKTGITLTMVGVVLTILSTLGGENIMKIFSEAWKNFGLIAAAFLILFSLSLVSTLFGMYKLMNVLKPRLCVETCGDELFEKDSRIFFRDIASNNEKYSQFQNKLLNYSNDDYLNDLQSQIFINSKICAEKFNCFYQGLIITIPNMLVMLAIVVISGFFVQG